MNYKGHTLDLFQEKAIHAIEQNKSVVVSAPTGSGKTLIADYIIERDVKQGVRVIYTAPIKALSNQKYKEFSQEYGEENVGLLTGDVVKNPDALVLIMTTEIYRNMAIVGDPIIEHVSYVVFDEIHYINDIERGYVWEESIIFSKPHIRVLCLSATIPNAEEFARWIEAIKGHPVEIVRHEKRAVPLHIGFYDKELGVTTLEKLKEIIDIPDYDYFRGRSRRRRPDIPLPSHVDLIADIADKLPCLFFSFSRSACQRKAMELAKKNLFKANPEISALVSEKLNDAAPQISQLDSTRALRQTLPYGIGFHHAGLLPIMKELVEELFSRGLLNVLYTTETFALGVNMPAKSVCFESLRKFDGKNFRMLNSKEYFQIAGRAGRRGIDTEGYVYLIVERRDFDYEKVKRMIAADTEPINSQFRLSVNTSLNLIKQHTPQEINEILCKSFHSFQKFGTRFGTMKNHLSHSTFNNFKRRLEKQGYLKNGTLTEKGEFASQIYADEIVIGEMFATHFYKGLNEYQILMLLACICYERRESTVFTKTFPSQFIRELKRKLYSDGYLSKEPRFEEMDNLTALIHPCYHGSTVFDIINNTNLLEGDIVRFFRQIVDRIHQVKSATRDRLLITMLENCQQTIMNCLKGIEEA